MRMPTSPDVTGPAQTAVLLAVMVIHEAHGLVSIPEIQLATKHASRSTVHTHLVALREAGLVAWEPTRRNTLRPLVARSAIEV